MQDIPRENQGQCFLSLSKLFKSLRILFAEILRYNNFKSNFEELFIDDDILVFLFIRFFFSTMLLLIKGMEEEATSTILYFLWKVE